MDKTKKKKKQLMMSRQKVRRIVGFTTLGVLVLAIAAYIFIDSRSYVATVQGSRITAYEYRFLLNQQVLTTEQNEGLSSKTADEKKKYWTSTENGQNPWETAKNQTLDASKKYMIELNKAYEMGLKIDNTIRNEVASTLASKKQSGGFNDSSFADYVLQQTKVNINQYTDIMEKTTLIKKFITQYFKNNYTPETIPDSDIKAEYDKDPKKYDTVDFSYILFTKKDANNQLLAQDELTKLKASADEALKQINAGGEINNIYSSFPGSVQGFFVNSGFGQENTPGKVTAAPYITGTLNNFQTFVDYLFNNPVGSSSVVETDDYYIAVKIDKHTVFDDIKDTVKAKIENDKQIAWFNDQEKQWTLDPKNNIIKNDPVYDSITYDSISK